jgi:hypothetical protein
MESWHDGSRYAHPGRSRTQCLRVSSHQVSSHGSAWHDKPSACRHLSNSIWDDLCEKRLQGFHTIDSSSLPRQTSISLLWKTQHMQLHAAEYIPPQGAPCPASPHCRGPSSAVVDWEARGALRKTAGWHILCSNSSSRPRDQSSRLSDPGRAGFGHDGTSSKHGGSPRPWG